MIDHNQLTADLDRARIQIAALQTELRHSHAQVATLQALNQEALAADHQYPSKRRRNDRPETYARQRHQIELLKAENARTGTRLALAINDLAAQALRIQDLTNQRDQRHHSGD